MTSAGGVLLEVLSLAREWRGGCRFVAADAVDTREELRGETVLFRTECPAISIALGRELWRALADLASRRPALLVSAGTGLAVPWFVAAWLLRVPLVWVETLNIVGENGLAAKVCSRLASVVAVQRGDRLGAHRRAVLVGDLY